MQHLIFMRGLGGQSKNTHYDQSKEHLNIKVRGGEKKGRAESFVQLQGLMNDGTGWFTLS